MGMTPVPDYITEADYGDIMVDLETGGTTPGRHPMIQLAAVRFDLERGWLHHDFFCASLTIPPHLHWEESTRDWWLKDKRELLAKILSQQEDWREVLIRFQKWVGPSKPRFWSKPTSFDFPILQSYYKDAGLHFPFHYRTANDLNSWIRARYWPRSPKYDERSIGEFTGELHNAIDDVLHQIKLLFTVVADTAPGQYSAPL